MPRVHHVKKAQKKNPVAEVGESYYWWKFRYGGKRYSTTRPKPSQLTNSAFLSQAYSVAEMLDAWKPDEENWRDDIETIVDSMKSEVESLREMAEESLENMPENLRESSSSGELLQERIDECESWESRLDDVSSTIADDEEMDLDGALDELQAAADYEGS